MTSLPSNAAAQPVSASGAADRSARRRRTRPRRVLQASCAAAALVSANAFAEDAAKPVVLDMITVAAKSATPGEVEVTPEDLERRAPSDLQGVFAGETAITVGNAIAPVQKIYLHGIEDSQLSLTIDGVRQPHGTFHHAGNILLDPGMLKAVEIRPGVAAADDGPQAAAGTIKFETKDARDLLAPNQAFGGFGGLRWDSNGNTFRETLSLYGQAQGFEALVYGTNIHGSDYDDGDGDEIAGTAAELYDILGKAAWTGSGGYRLEASADYTRDDGDRQLRANFGGIVGAPTLLMGYQLERTTALIGLKDEQPEGWFAPDIQLSYNKASVDVTDDFGSTALSGFLPRFGEIETFQGKFANDFEVPIGVVTAGVDFQLDEATGGENGLRFTEESQQTGLFAQARIEPMDRLFLSFGGRADYQWFEGIEGSDFDDGGLSGNIAVDYAATDWLTLNAGYSHIWGGFRLGEAAIYNAFGVQWTYDGFEPSKADNFRVGFDVAHAGFFGSAGLFHTKINDAQNLQSSNRGDSADVRTQGVDASVGYRSDRLFARASYTFADVKIDGENSGTTIDYLAQQVGHLFALEASYMVLDGLTVGGAARIALEDDGPEGLPAARGTTHEELPGYEVVDVYLDYAPPEVPGLSLRAGVNNLFDEAYQERTSNGAGQGQLIVPLNEPGRSFFVAAKYAF